MNGPLLVRGNRARGAMCFDSTYLRSSSVMCDRKRIYLYPLCKPSWGALSKAIC